MAIAAATGAAVEEIRVAMTVAHSAKRNEDAARSKILRSCQRKAFAEECLYRFKRGTSEIVGPSVVLTRELSRLWGNMRSGIRIVSDDRETRTVSGWAWDMESNTYEAQEVVFRKLIQRKGGDGKTVWVVPDERDLRELSNKQGAIALRNCVLHLLPFDLLLEVEDAARATLRADVERDPDRYRREVVDAFDALNVPVAELEAFLGHSLGSASPDELERLRGVYKAIKNEGAKWADYYSTKREEKKAEVTGGFAGAVATPGARGGESDRQFTLPASLRPDKDDPRDLFAFLMDTVPVLDQADRDIVKRALPNLQLKPKQVLELVQVLASVEDDDAEEDGGEDPEETEGDLEASGGGQEEDTETAPPEKPDDGPKEPARPPEVADLLRDIDRVGGEMALGMLLRRWTDLVAGNPELETWDGTIRGAVENRSARIREKKGGKR